MLLSSNVVLEDLGREEWQRRITAAHQTLISRQLLCVVCAELHQVESTDVNCRAVCLQDVTATHILGLVDDGMTYHSSSTTTDTLHILENLFDRTRAVLR